MEKASYWQRGETIDYVNSGTEIIEANTIIVLGSRIGVAGTDILPGEKGSLHVTGVFEMPKCSSEVAAGADVYYSQDSGEISTSAENGTKAGFAVCDAGNNDPFVYVKINA
jgi:predicted RecA/RadA family phage recombinase